MRKHRNILFWQAEANSPTTYDTIHQFKFQINWNAPSHGPIHKRTNSMNSMKNAKQITICRFFDYSISNIERPCRLWREREKNVRISSIVVAAQRSTMQHQIRMIYIHNSCVCVCDTISDGDDDYY